MSFVSISFGVLFLVALALRCTVGATRQHEAYLYALLVLSLVFYAWHVPAYLALILCSIATVYTAALAIERASGRPRLRTVWLVAALVINLGLLGYFKYAGFLLEIAGELGALMGLSIETPAVAIILPIGISFYTFQAVSYIVDVYRGDLRAETRLHRLGLYIGFFPQLVAGPIVRAGEFLYQLSRRRKVRARVFLAGGYLVLRGVFLKMVVADNLGVIVDDRWEDAAVPGAPLLLVLSLLVFFSAQLFCDFAGYSDIARGLAYMLGFRLPVNFNAPYIAASFREFWRRWHISLSQWMRDYCYIPLGGDREGSARGVGNVLLVMAISGLWHGANVNFVCWGVLHGVAVVIERLLGLGCRSTAASRRWFRGLLWFPIVQLVWILSMGLFRAEDGTQAQAILGNVFSGIATLDVGDVTAPEGWPRIVTGWYFTLPVWLLHARVFATERLGLAEASVVERSVYAGFMLYAVLTLYATSRGFIYFQF